MPKNMLPFGDLRPDIATLDSQFARVADNVFSDGNSYKPVPSPIAITSQTLTGALGLCAVRKADGTWIIYAGTATKLWRWTTALGWVDVSRLAGGAYNLTAPDLWTFAQFGTTLIACQINDVVQSIDIEAGANFAALAGSPPTARAVTVIGDFVVLAGLSSNQRSIAWSAINDSTGWTPGLNLSDIQTFPDQGPVQGVTGSETSAYVVQDRGIRSMQFLPGDTNFIFNFNRVVKERGSISKYGFTTVSDVLYVLCDDGFYQLAGTQLIPIGQDKINEYFLSISDVGRRNVVQCFSFDRPYIIWPFYGSTSSSTYDRWIIFNWVTQRWTTATISAAVWGMLATANIDLDHDSGETGDAVLDTAGLPSLDSFAYQGGRPAAMGINAAGILSAIKGPALQAIIETAEVHPVPGQRAYVSEAYPLVDAPGGTITPFTRESLQDTAPIQGADTPVEVTGAASVLCSGRLHRYRYTAPAGVTWTHAQGILIEAQPDGYA